MCIFRNVAFIIGNICVQKISIFQFADGGTLETSPNFFKPKVRIFKQEVRIFNILEQGIFLKQIFKIFSLKMNPAKLVEKLEILILSPPSFSFSLSI